MLLNLCFSYVYILKAHVLNIIWQKWCYMEWAVKQKICILKVHIKIQMCFWKVIIIILLHYDFCILKKSKIKNLEIYFRKQMNIPLYYFFLAEDNWQVLNLLNDCILSSFKKFRMECDSITFLFGYYLGGKNHQTHVHRVKICLVSIRCSYGYNYMCVIVNV